MVNSITFYCPRWGSGAVAWETFLEGVAKDGYDGFEWGISRDTPEKELHEVWELAQRRGLNIIPQHFDTTEADFGEHCERYAAWFEKFADLPVTKINAQTGKDFYTFEQNCALLGIADAFAERTGVAVLHETHRGRFSFAAHVTQQYLEARPNLRLTLDASHWVNVAESYLYDQPEALALATERTEHLHARVGHTQAPQVPDPRADEWRAALEVHLGWWDRLVERKRAAGDAELTIAPEFGPPPISQRCRERASPSPINGRSTCT